MQTLNNKTFKTLWGFAAPMNRKVFLYNKMAENKKSFIAYSDWNGMFKALPDEVAGKLIKHVFSYVNDEDPETDDYVIAALFEQIKATLKRDLDKWDKQREQRRKAGLKSAEIRATKSNDRSTTVNETERKATVSVNDSVSVSEIIDKPITTKEVDLSVNDIFRKSFESNKADLKDYCRMFKTNEKTILYYLDLFQAHLRSVVKKVKNSQSEYQQHFAAWLRKQEIQTIKEAYKNPYMNADGSFHGIAEVKRNN